MTTQQTEALQCAADLEARLEAIGAGGVSGPLIGQPQAMPDLSQLTERGAKAWAGVDAQGLWEGGADMSKERDDLTAFYAWLHTYESEVGALDDGSARVGFIAGRASLQPPGFTAADMATVSAQGFRDGVASVSAGWISVDERLPEPGNPVLLDIGKKYPIRALWAAKNTVRVGTDVDDWGEYDEETDEYYCPEGWYEWNEHEEVHWAVSETPRAWSELPPPLPAAPGPAAGESNG